MSRIWLSIGSYQGLLTQEEYAENYILAIFSWKGNVYAKLREVREHVP